MWSVNDGLATAVLSPCDVFVTETSCNRVVDINHFYVTLVHTNTSILKATTRQHDIRRVCELAPCAGCLEPNDIRASTPHHVTAWAASPMDIGQIKTTGLFHESLGGSQYVIISVDSSS